MNHLTLAARLGVLTIVAGCVLAVFATFTGPLNDGRVLGALGLVAFGGTVWLASLALQRRAAAARQCRRATLRASSMTSTVRIAGGVR